MNISSKQHRCSLIAGKLDDGQSHRRYRTAFAVAMAAASLLGAQIASAITISSSVTLVNSGFDVTTGLTGTLPANNNLDFATNPISGWTEYDTTGANAGNPSVTGIGNNVGPINVAPSDITAETTSGALALYHQNSGVRIDQTTSYVISSANTSFSVGVDVGDDSAGGFGGYVISLYADNGLGTKTTLKTISTTADGGNPANNSYLQKTLTLAPADFSGVLGQKIGVSLSAESSSAAVFYDTVALNYTAQGVSIGLQNPGFDDTTGLPGLPGANDSYDFVNAYVGWTEVDNTGAPIVGTNVGPINVKPGDITSETTSGALALYQGNAAVRVQQTTNHVISASDASIAVAVDVGNDVLAGFGGYVISLYADNGLGTKTTLKTISTTADGGNPADDSYFRKTLTLTPSEYTAYLGQKIGVSLSGEGAPRDMFYDSVTLDFTTQGTPINVVNAGFDVTTGLTGTLPGNNNLDFATNPISGWTEYDTAGANAGNPSVTGVGNNVGPINVAPGDITTEATSGALALYHQNADVRIDQTTTHIISASDTSFRLLVDVGNDSGAGFGGYLISLYAEDGLGVKTTLTSIRSSIDGYDPADNAWLTKALTLNVANFVDFDDYWGQKIGISLSAESSSAAVFYDSVNLTFTFIPVPEPSTSLLFVFSAVGLIAARRRYSAGPDRHADK